MQIIELLGRAQATTGGVLSGLTAESFDAPTPCPAWTAHQLASHLVGGIVLLARVVEGERVELAEYDPQALADGGHLGDDPAEAFHAAAERSAAAFKSPEVLDHVFPFAGETAPGHVVANIAVMETLVHGWDLARAAGMPYEPDAEVVAAVKEFTAMAVTGEIRATGRFGPPVPVPANAAPMTGLLAHLGRTA